MIKRLLSEQIKGHLFKGKTILLTGPRQVGKTTLLSTLADQETPPLFLDGDEPDLRNLLTDANTSQLKNLIGQAKLVVIDEAQRIKNIGLTAKLIHDKLKVQLILSGSSALELANQVHEPLTGRVVEFNLFPVSFGEMKTHHGLLEERRLLEHRLLYGMYPDIINHPSEAELYLRNLINGYLYKDVFNFQEVRRPDLIPNLLEALARQMGQEVNYFELGTLLRCDAETVRRYIELLEKTYVIFRLRSYSRNLRNELKKSQKIYFYDLGVRNALISAFQPVALRSDSGQMWENFMVAERFKFLVNTLQYPNRYFWRTTAQQEIDYIEERDGRTEIFEFKFNPDKQPLISKTFLNNYHPDAMYFIHRDNYFDHFV